MAWLLLAAIIVVLCFGLVVFIGAPYLPTLRPQIETAFELLELKPGQTMLELGCGDGRVLVAAAQRGIRSIGYELNPLLFMFAWLRTRRYRKLISVRFADFWTTKWPQTDAIFGFILPKYMSKLDKKVMQQVSKPVKVISFAFAIPDRRPLKAKANLFLYEYR